MATFVYNNTSNFRISTSHTFVSTHKPNKRDSCTKVNGTEHTFMLTHCTTQCQLR